MNIDTQISEVAARQHGVVSYEQLLACGCNRQAIHWRVHTRRLHRVIPRVYSVGHATLSQDGRWMAATLFGGEGAVLSHTSAALLLGSWRERDSVPHVTTAARRRARLDVCVHGCRGIAAADAAEVRGIPCTAIERTLLDLGGEFTKWQLAHVMHMARHRRLFSAARMHERIDTIKSWPGIVTVRAALDLHANGSAGTRSPLEDRFLSLILANDIPEPEVNMRMFNIEWDFLWRAQRLVVETDGSPHGDAPQRKIDRDKEELLRKQGFRVLRYGWWNVEELGDIVVAELQHNLGLG